MIHWSKIFEFIREFNFEVMAKACGVNVTIKSLITIYTLTSIECRHYFKELLQKRWCRVVFFSLKIGLPVTRKIDELWFCSVKELL